MEEEHEKVCEDKPGLAIATLKASLKSKRVIPELPSVTERYYDIRYVKEIQGNLAEQIILFHSNRICLITLSPTHPILLGKKTVVQVDFRAGGKVNCLKNQVSGKWKRGGQQLKQHSLLCEIHCNDSSMYTIYSCLNGTLVEINQKLIEKPHLVFEKPWSDGYIAIVLPTWGSSDLQKDALVSWEPSPSDEI